MAKSVDDNSMEMVKWPFLLPEDFVPWPQTYIVFVLPLCFYSSKSLRVENKR